VRGNSKHNTILFTNTTTIATMQNSIFRSVRLAGQAASHARATPFASQSQCLFARLPAPTRSRIASRWYSSEQAKDENLGASGNTGEEPTVVGGAKPDAENPVQKELEAAKKEAVDLKV
jgi:hypothetical protein